MATCTTCGQALTSEARFCAACGRSTAPAVALPDPRPWLGALVRAWLVAVGIVFAFALALAVLRLVLERAAGYDAAWWEPLLPRELLLGLLYFLSAAFGVPYLHSDYQPGPAFSTEPMLGPDIWLVFVLAIVVKEMRRHPLAVVDWRHVGQRVLLGAGVGVVLCVLAVGLLAPLAQPTEPWAQQSPSLGAVTWSPLLLGAFYGGLAVLLASWPEIHRAAQGHPATAWKVAEVTTAWAQFLALAGVLAVATVLTIGAYAPRNGATRGDAVRLVEVAVRSPGLYAAAGLAAAALAPQPSMADSVGGAGNWQRGALAGINGVDPVRGSEGGFVESLWPLSQVGMRDPAPVVPALWVLFVLGLGASLVVASRRCRAPAAAAPGAHWRQGLYVALLVCLLVCLVALRDGRAHLYVLVLGRVFTGTLLVQPLAFYLGARWRPARASRPDTL